MAAIKISDLEPSDELFEHQRIICDPGQASLRIDKFLFERLEKVSRNRVQKAIDAGCILVQGKVVKSNYKVRPSDEISLVLPRDPIQEQTLEPEHIPLDIYFEDEHLMVINKPAGLVVHPGVGHHSGTLVNALLWHFQHQKKTGSKGLPVMPGNAADRPGLVHRIDKDTSGLILIAKNEFAMAHLAKQFYDHTIDREYIALVETGRTHQIRVHMKWKGHTLFQDERYGGNRILKGTIYTKYRQFVENCFEIMPRQALHARSLGFIHPVTGEKLLFESAFPSDFSQVVEKWRAYVDARRQLIQQEME